MIRRHKVYMDAFKQDRKNDPKLEQELLSFLSNNETLFLNHHALVDKAGFPFTKRASSSR